MAKETVKKFDYERLKRKDPLLYRQLLYEIACLFVKKRLNYSQIRKEIYKRASDSKSQHHEYYDKNGEDNIKRSWVPRRIAEAIKNDFITLGDFEDADLRNDIYRFLPEAKDVNITLAPDNDALIRQACLDFDKKLTDKVKSSPRDTQIIVGVSGGKTLLEFTKTLHDIRKSLKWSKEVPDMKMKNKKVIICSLTSGGSRENIAALSDTVAANIAQELDVQASGFLGPPLFKDKEAKDIFIKDEEVQSHIDFAHRANIILTSVGNVNDDEALTSQIINSVDSNYLAELRGQYAHLGDILYNCYNGDNGNPIPLVPIHDRVFSVIACRDLWTMVDNKQTECIVVAKGYKKGYHALCGLIVRTMASDIHMDFECARGLIAAAKER